MAPVQVEDDFMAALFEDLDATTFSALPSSPSLPSTSQPPRRPSSQLSPRKRKTPHPPTPPPPSQHPPSPFWKSNRVFPPPPPPAAALANTSSSTGPSSPLGSILKPKLSQSPVKKSTSSATAVIKPRQIKHVEISIRGKENDEINTGDALRPRTRELDVKRKGKQKLDANEDLPRAKRAKVEEIDFDALCDGMDWEDDLESSMATSQKDKPPSFPRGKQYTRCTVESVVEKEATGGAKRLVKELMVKLSKDEHDETAKLYTVLLCNDWAQTPVEIGDTINLIGPFSPLSTPSLTLDRQSNLLILHPDILVSSTKVADSSHCSRKALLQEIIRSSSGSVTPALVYGNMLHELMQLCLEEGEWSDKWKEEKIQGILRRELKTLWSIELEVEVAMEQMRERSKGFEGFKNTFLGDKPGPTANISDPHQKDSTAARLAITETLDVEEDIWSPKYGLKGKVDVSVSGRIAEGPFVGDSKTLPFEIKTGKASMGMEHRAQTMLYTLLMSDRYDEEITSGLLYYTQPNQVFKVTAARNEIRGLIINRNEFATYHHRRMTLSDFDLGTDLEVENDGDVKGEKKEKRKRKTEVDMEDLELPLLPAPIDEARSCKWCYVADACMLYRKAVEGEERIDEDDGDPLQMQFDDRTGHLTPDQSAFFKKWEKLISLEEQELVRFKKEIWTMGAEERMKVGRCMANMAIDESYEPPSSITDAKIHRYTYRLQHALPLATQATATQQAARSLLGGSITVNDPIVVSLEAPNVLGVARGFVLAITPHDVVLGLDHSLVDNAQALRENPNLDPSDLVFRIDKDELAAGMGRIRDNLIQLFLVNGDERRRRLVVDLEPPVFKSIVLEKKLFSSTLNEDQTEAVKKVLLAKDYALILGMPGTGKTTTIAHVLKALVKSGKSVLLTSYTHSAVDNILLKVKDEGLSILRLGNRDKIMPELHHYTLESENKAATLAQLDKLLMEPRIVATTCLSINDPIFTRRKFDVCIVDEASQVTLPTCLGPLRFADTFILVGDHNQLPPLVRNRDAREGGLDVSLFKRLSDAHPEAIVYLSRQYRMNDDIMHLSNQLVYENRLTAGSEAVASQTLKIRHPEALDNLDEDVQHGPEGCWLQEILSEKRKVVFVDTDLLPAKERKIGPLIDNEIEASLVLQTTAALVRCGVPETEIGVIASYRQQIKLLSRQLSDYSQVEVLTADRSQGRDKDCIIMSLTRSNPDGQVGDLLKDWRRINVCLTRAKSKLIVFGSRSTLTHAEILSQFFDVVAEKGWIYQLPANAHRAHAVVSRWRSPVAERKSWRAGPEKLVLSQPLVRDVVNSL